MRLRGATIGGIAGACIAFPTMFLAVITLEGGESQRAEVERRFSHRRLVDAQLGLHRHADAARAAVEYVEAVPDAWDAYGGAGFLAKCVLVARLDAKLGAADQEKVCREYADKAVALLREAVRRGFRNVAHIEKDPDLDPIRDHPEFQRLLREIQGDR